ncbi:MAG: glycosyltransferase, partial [Deltaproteobacteria bacterium]|nr:glycosyltransferase [Deltaproteobacteria bacterium]
MVLVGNYIPGTQDKTKEIVKNIASRDKKIKAIAKPKEGMMGWDMLEGMKVATGRYICVIDGDGQFPIDSIEKCFLMIKTKKLDLVKTYRTVRHDGVYRKFVSKAYNILFKVLFPGLKCKDVNSKPKILSRELFNKMDLTPTGWFIDAEIMI